MKTSFLKLNHLLLASKPEFTKYIIEHSCNKLFLNFLSLLEFLISQRGISDKQKNEIQDTIEYIKNQDIHTLLRMLTSPIFRGWYSKFGQVENFSEENSLLESLLKNWNNSIYSFHFSDNFECTFNVVNNICHSWDSILIFKTQKYNKLFIKKENNCFEIFDGHKASKLAFFVYNNLTYKIEGCELVSSDLEIIKPTLFLPNSSISIRNDIPSLCLRLTGNLERELAIGDTFDFSLNSYNPSFNQSEFILAAQLIENNWPEEYQDFIQTLQIVIPREVPFGWRARGMTVSSYQGAVWLMARGILPIFENLIHEQSHVKLRYIEEFVPILKEGQNNDRYKVGWRTDPRPLIGIYEGVYVHMHMLMGLVLLLENRVNDFSVDQLSVRIKHLQSEIAEGIDILSQNAIFTDEGKFFVDWAKDILRESSA